MTKKSGQRLLRRVLLRWQDVAVARREQKRDAMRLLCNIRAREETTAAWRLWTSHARGKGQAQQGRGQVGRSKGHGEEKEEGYEATVVAARRSLPVVGLSQTMPRELEQRRDRGQGEGQRGEVDEVKKMHAELQRLYGKLFKLVQTFRGEVVRGGRRTSGSCCSTRRVGVSNAV